MNNLRPQVHRLHDLAAAAFHRFVLKEFSHPVEQHHAYRFRVFPDAEGADGSQGHEEILVEHMAPHQILQGRYHNLSAQHHIGRQTDQEGGPAQALPQQQPQQKQSAAQKQLQALPVVLTMGFLVIVVMRFTAAAVVMVVLPAPAALPMAVRSAAAGPFLSGILTAFSAAAAFSMMVSALGGHPIASFPDLHLRFYAPGDLGQLRNQVIRGFCRQPQLLGGEGDDRLFHLGVVVELAFYFRRTVGAVQILNGIDLFRHTRFLLIYFYI